MVCPGKSDTSKKTKYLVVIRLTSTPCVVAAVKPGAGQQREARVKADSAKPLACLKPAS